MTPAIEKSQQTLTHHPLFGKLTDLAALRVFMEAHVFAVWDFMSLLKRLQRDITCVEVPWRPSPHSSKLVRFINQIVVGEESDLDAHGGPCSHFELYLRAMREVGADTSRIEAFLRTTDFQLMPEYVRSFVKANLDVAMNAPTLEVAASFFYGREKLIPDMFTSIVRILREAQVEAPTLLYYLERHIQVDGEEHGPLALECLAELAAGSEEKRLLAEAQGLRSLKERSQLWDGVLRAIESGTHAAL